MQKKNRKIEEMSKEKADILTTASWLRLVTHKHDSETNLQYECHQIYERQERWSCWIKTKHLLVA